MNIAVFTNIYYSLWIKVFSVLSHNSSILSSWNGFSQWWNLTELCIFWHVCVFDEKICVYSKYTNTKYFLLLIIKICRRATNLDSELYETFCRATGNQLRVKCRSVVLGRFNEFVIYCSGGVNLSVQDLLCLDTRIEDLYFNIFEMKLSIISLFSVQIMSCFGA